MKSKLLQFIRGHLQSQRPGLWKLTERRPAAPGKRNPGRIRRTPAPSLEAGGIIHQNRATAPSLAARHVAGSYETEFMGDGRKLSFSWRYSFSLNEIMYRYIGFGFILPYEATKQSSSINNCSIIPTESCWARS